MHAYEYLQQDSIHGGRPKVVNRAMNTYLHNTMASTLQVRRDLFSPGGGGYRVAQEAENTTRA